MGILNYTTDQTKSWMTGKTDAQVAEQAASMGLNRGQIREAYSTIGKNYTDADLDGYAQNNGYTFGANGALSKAPTVSASASQPSQNAPGGFTAGGKTWTQAELNKFYADGGDDVKFAAENGLSREDILRARQIGGAPTGDAAVQQAFNRYRTANPNGTYADNYQAWVNDQAPHRLDAIKSGTYTGDGGDQSPQDYKNAYEAGQGGMGWKGQGWGGPSGGGAGGGAGGAPGASGGGSASPGGAGGGSSSGGSTSAGGTSGPGNWQVTPEQTVESRVAGILAAGNPLVTQRRAQSDMKMNSRGMVNSSIAQTASDDAAYSAALDIARPDAATYADAAKTNAMAKTTWGISQANNQTSRDNTQAQIGAQRELQRATQLYNNLTNQTSTATSLQQWGLNTVASIQASDLSAEAKSAAIGTIQQYLADSYQIQGDWHTTAARMIDSIFD